MREYRAFWIALLLLAVATPLGLLLPELMKAGGAWGEWGLEEVREMVGYVPAGMRKLSDLWKAPIPEYAPPGQEEAPIVYRSLSYILAALLGIGLCGGATYLLTRWLTKKNG
jgi:cobalt/nickel transport protein